MSDESNAWVTGFFRMQMVREAVASVAMEHAEDCACTACRAVAGDVDALTEIFAVLGDE
jgi:hypothetical protein